MTAKTIHSSTSHTKMTSFST